MKFLSAVILRRYLKQLCKIASDTSRSPAVAQSYGATFWHPVRTISTRETMELYEVVDRLQKYACPSLAASWDNVGLLVEPSAPHTVSRMLLTNDLTPEVLQEALKLKADMILSYHPPIFQPLKRLTQKSWKERVLVKCMENRIAVYSPHTSYDVIRNGINDWLIAPFEGKSEPIITSLETPSLGEYSVSVNLPRGLPDGILDKLPDTVPTATISGYTGVGADSGGAVRLGLTCAKKSLPEVVALFKESQPRSLEIVELVKSPLPGHGYGRLTLLDRPMAIQDAIHLIKSHLKMIFVRLALGSAKTKGSMIQSVAVCAGSGSSVLRGVKADLYLTGEMSHHDVLDAVQNGTSVVLCDHSNTERGFLTVLRQTLDVLFEQKVNISLSTSDRDPLEIL